VYSRVLLVQNVGAVVLVMWFLNHLYLRPFHHPWA